MRISGIEVNWDGWHYVPNWQIFTAKVKYFRKVVCYFGPMTISFGIYD